MSFDHVDWNRVSQWVYEAGRVNDKLCGRPIQVEPWEVREEPFRQQFIEAVRTFCSQEIIPTPDALHESWMKKYYEMGWTYGPVRDPIAKTHPDLVPFNQLDPKERDKDYVFSALLLAARQLIQHGIFTASEAPYDTSHVSDR